MDYTKAIAYLQSQNFPFFSYSFGALGGSDSLLVAISLEPKENRPNGYLENSKYIRLSIHFDDGNHSYYNYGSEPKITIEAFTNTTDKKINKKTIKDIPNAEPLLLKQLAKISNILKS